MRIILKRANFSSNNIGVSSVWSIFTILGDGATYSGPKFINKGESFTGTVTVSDGYNIISSNISVMMGTTDITSTAVTISNNIVEINVNSVTGNISINIPTRNTSIDVGEGETTLVFANQNLIDGYIDRNGTVLSPEGRHKHFTIPAEGIDTITITPPMAGAINSLYYLIHIDDEGTITTYFNIKDGVTPGVSQTVTLGGVATGTLYFNAFQDEVDGSYSYLKEAVITTAGNNDNSDSVGSEVYIFASAPNRTQGYITGNGNLTSSTAHYYSSIPAEGVKSISVTPTKAGAVDTLYYIIHKASDGTVTPYVNLKESIGVTKTINFGGTATGTIYFNEFTDNTNAGYEYLTQAIIER